MDDEANEQQLKRDFDYIYEMIATLSSEQHDEIVACFQLDNHFCDRLVWSTIRNDNTSWVFELYQQEVKVSKIFWTYLPVGIKVKHIPKSQWNAKSVKNQGYTNED